MILFGQIGCGACRMHAVSSLKKSKSLQERGQAESTRAGIYEGDAAENNWPHENQEIRGKGIIDSWVTSDILENIKSMSWGKNIKNKTRVG